MNIDFLDELLTLIKSTGVTPEQYMIEHSLFFDNAVVDDAFNELLYKFNNRQPIHVRKTTKKTLVYKVGNKNVWKSIYKNIPDLDVTIDSDGNRKVRSLITNLTGETISQGVNSSIMFGKISHIWGEATNPLFFTALWNIVLVPAYFNDILDKNAGTNPSINRIKEIYKAICWTKYDVENKLKKLRLTPQEISWYKPNVSVLYGFSYKLTTIPMKVQKPITKGKKTTSGNKIKPLRNYQKYTINGKGSYPKCLVPKEAVLLYSKHNPKKNGRTIVKDWVALNIKVPYLIETQADFNNRIANSKDKRARTRSEAITLPNGDVVYVSKQITPKRIQDLITKVNAQSWGITIA